MSNDLIPSPRKTVVESAIAHPAGSPALPKMGDSWRIVEVLQSHFGADGGRMHTAAEIGCHRGATSALLLRTFPNLMLWLVDPYASYQKTDAYRQSGDSLSKLTRAEQHQHYLAAKEATAFASGRCMFCKFPSTAAAKIISTPRLSFAFLDGAHDLQSVRDDIAAWWPKVEAGGVLAGHDFLHPRDGKQFGVKQAVEEFIAATGLELNTLGSIWWVVKR